MSDSMATCFIDVGRLALRRRLKPRGGGLHLVCLLCLCLLPGCGQKDGHLLGKAPEGEPRRVVLLQGGESPARVVVRGRMVEKCPVAGCWFRLQDDTGTIKVDTKTAGFAVSYVPLGATVTVGGKLAWDGAEMMVQASGLRY
jgi:hypothetical protein